jgi:RNA recognition motif-containing protein
MNIYVGNMHFSLSNEDVNNLFSQFGSVTSAKIINDKVTGRSKGFGFVEMENDEDARKAIAGLNESEVMGRKLIVNEARPQEQRSGRRWRWIPRWRWWRRLQQRRRRWWI